MKIKKRIKNYFTETPKVNIWRRACFYLILLNYVGFSFLITIVPFILGLLSPGVDVSDSFATAGENIGNAYEKGMNIMFKAGENIAINNPILSKGLAFFISHVVWIFYLGFALMIIDGIRYFIGWLINKKKLSIKSKTKEVKE